MQLAILFLLEILIAVVKAASRYVTREELNRIQEHILPNETWMFHFIIYCFCILLFICPPDFLVEVGLTTENILSSYLGNRETDVLFYNCKRVVLNRGLLTVYPFLFFMLLEFLEPSAVAFTVPPSRALHYIADFSLPIFLLGLTWAFFHHMTNYIYICPKNLATSNLQELNRQISAEIGNVDTFRHKVSNSSSLIITPTWVVYSSKFYFQVIRLQESSFKVIKAEELVLNPLNPEGAVQVMTMLIEPPPTGGNPIKVTLHNITLQDLMNTLNIHVDIPPEIVLKTPISDRFATIFAEEAAKNPPFYIDSAEELEPCLACAENSANLKLIKRCGEFQNEGENNSCRECRCRPMWCVRCMGKVFAAKQDKRHTAQWIAGKAPCPTCRATFCIFDVAMIKIR